nr:hypothetical protein [Candidatus Sigynarchaeota archaeon]
MSDSIEDNPVYRQPAFVSGYLNVYDVVGQVAGQYQYEYLGQYTRKITLIITPWHYQRFNTYRQLSVPSGATSLTYKTPQFTSGSLVLNANPGTSGALVDSLLVQYRKATSSKDIVIGNWDQIIDTATSDSSDTDPMHLNQTHGVHLHDVDNILLRSLYDVTDFKGATGTSYSVRYDTGFNTHSMMFNPGDVRANSVGAGTSWRVASDDHPLVAVIPDALPSLRDLSLLTAPYTGNLGEADEIYVDVYPNQRVPVGRDDSLNATYVTIPDFDHRFSTAPSAFQFASSDLDDGKLTFPLTGSLWTDQGRTERAEYSLKFNVPAWYVDCGAWAWETSVSMYHGSYGTLYSAAPDSILPTYNGAGEMARRTWLIYLYDMASSYGFTYIPEQPEEFVSYYNAWDVTSPSSPMYKFEETRHRIDVMIDVKDDARTIAGKVYAALINNKEFMASSFIKAERVADTITFTQEYGGTVVYGGQTYTPFLYSPDGPIGPYALGQYTTVKDGVGDPEYKDDGFINELDDYFGYTLVISGKKDGASACVNLSVSACDTQERTLTYIASSSTLTDDYLDGNGRFDATKIKAMQTTDMDLIFAVDRHREPTMQAWFKMPGVVYSKLTHPSTTAPDWSMYPRFGYQVTASNGSAVYKASITLYTRNDAGSFSWDGLKYRAYGVYEDYFDNKSTIVGVHDISNALGVAPSTIDLIGVTITWKTSDPTAQESCPVAFSGIWFEHETSIADMIIKWHDMVDIDNDGELESKPDTVLPLISEPLGLAKTWQSASWEGLVERSLPSDHIYSSAIERLIEGDVKEIAIVSKTSIDLSQVIISRSNIVGGYLSAVLYEKCFNTFTNLEQALQYKLGAMAVRPMTPDWDEGTDCVLTDRYDDFVLVDCFDRDYSADYYDTNIQYSDTELDPVFAWNMHVSSIAGVVTGQSVSGRSDVTGVPALGTVVGTSIAGSNKFITVVPTNGMFFAAGTLTLKKTGLADVTCQLLEKPEAVPFLDGNNSMTGYDLDGNGIAEVVVMDYSMTSFSTGDDVSVQQRYVAHEIRVDSNQDGAYDVVRTDYSRKASSPVLNAFLINWSDSKHAWEYVSWKYNKHEPTYGYTTMMDMNSDGTFEMIEDNVDEWPDKPIPGVSVDVDEYCTRTFETHYITRRTQVYDPFQGSFISDESEAIIDILVERTFIYQDYDGSHIYTMECIPFEDVPVIVDTRTYLAKDFWVDLHGSLYFVDDGSGNYGMAFVFTHDSYNQFDAQGNRVPIAIGVAFDYDCDHIINTSPAYYSSRNGGFRDAFFPTAWMLPADRNPVDFTQMIYDEAWRAYSERLATDALFWVEQVVNTAMQILIMTVSAIVTGVVSFYASPPVGLVVGFWVNMGLNYLWNQFSRNLWANIDKLLHKAQPKGLEYAKEEQITNSLSWITNWGELTRIYPYMSVTVDAIGCAAAFNKDPYWNYADIVGVGIKVPIYRPYVFSLYSWTGYTDADYQRLSTEEMHAWHDVYRSNGTVSTEAPLVVVQKSLQPNIGTPNWEVVNFEDITGKGEYKCGDSYEFKVTLQLHIQDRSSLFFVVMLPTVYTGTLEFSRQSVITPLFISISSQDWVDGKVFTYTIAGKITQDNAVFTIDPLTVDPSTGDVTQIFHYSDISTMYSAETSLRYFTNGRLQTILPVVDEKGRFGLEAFPASPTLPNFYRNSSSERLAIHDSLNRIVIHDWQQISHGELAEPVDYMYQVDYGITALLSHYSYVLSKASETNLFSPFLGGDIRIWAAEGAIEFVNVLATTIGSAALMSKITSILEAKGFALTKTIYDKELGQSYPVSQPLVLGENWGQEFSKAWATGSSWKMFLFGLKVVYKFFVKEELDELFKEKLVSDMLRLMGFPDDFCEFMGEAAWSLGELNEATRDMRKQMRESAIARRRAFNDWIMNARQEAEQQCDFEEMRASMLERQANDPSDMRHMQEEQQKGMRLEDKAQIQAEQEARNILTTNNFVQTVLNKANLIAKAWREGHLAQTLHTILPKMVSNVQMTAFDRYSAVAAHQGAANIIVNLIIDQMRAVAEYNDQCARSLNILNPSDRIKTYDFLNSPALKALLGVDADCKIQMSLYGTSAAPGEVNDLGWWSVEELDEYEYVSQTLINRIEEAETIDLHDPTNRETTESLGRQIGNMEIITQKLKDAIGKLPLSVREAINHAQNLQPRRQASQQRQSYIPTDNPVMELLMQLGLYEDITSMGVDIQDLAGGNAIERENHALALEKRIKNDGEKIKKFSQLFDMLVELKTLYERLVKGDSGSQLGQFLNPVLFGKQIPATFEDFLLAGCSKSFSMRDLFGFVQGAPGKVSVQKLLFVWAMLAADIGMKQADSYYNRMRDAIVQAGSLAARANGLSTIPSIFFDQGVQPSSLITGPVTDADREASIESLGGLQDVFTNYAGERNSKGSPGRHNNMFTAYFQVFGEFIMTGTGLLGEYFGSETHMTQETIINPRTRADLEAGQRYPGQPDGVLHRVMEGKNGKGAITRTMSMDAILDMSTLLGWTNGQRMSSSRYGEGAMILTPGQILVNKIIKYTRAGSLSVAMKLLAIVTLADPSLLTEDSDLFRALKDLDLDEAHVAFNSIEKVGRVYRTQYTSQVPMHAITMGYVMGFLTEVWQAGRSSSTQAEITLKMVDENYQTQGKYKCTLADLVSGVDLDGTVHHPSNWNEVTWPMITTWLSTVGLEDSTIEGLNILGFKQQGHFEVDAIHGRVTFVSVSNIAVNDYLNKRDSMVFFGENGRAIWPGVGRVADSDLTLFHEVCIETNRQVDILLTDLASTVNTMSIDEIIQTISQTRGGGLLDANLLSIRVGINRYMDQVRDAIARSSGWRSTQDIVATIACGHSYRLSEYLWGFVLTIPMGNGYVVVKYKWASQQFTVTPSEGLNVPDGLRNYRLFDPALPIDFGAVDVVGNLRNVANDLLYNFNNRVDRFSWGLSQVQLMLTTLDAYTHISTSQQPSGPSVVALSNLPYYTDVSQFELELQRVNDRGFFDPNAPTATIIDTYSPWSPNLPPTAHSTVVIDYWFDWPTTSYWSGEQMRFQAIIDVNTGYVQIWVMAWDAGMQQWVQLSQLASGIGIDPTDIGMQYNPANAFRNAEIVNNVCGQDNAQGFTLPDGTVGSYIWHANRVLPPGVDPATAGNVKWVMELSRKVGSVETVFVRYTVEMPVFLSQPTQIAAVTCIEFQGDPWNAPVYSPVGPHAVQSITGYLKFVSECLASMEKSGYEIEFLETSPTSDPLGQFVLKYGSLVIADGGRITPALPGTYYHGIQIDNIYGDSGNVILHVREDGALNAYRFQDIARFKDIINKARGYVDLANDRAPANVARAPMRLVGFVIDETGIVGASRYRFRIQWDVWADVQHVGTPGSVNIMIGTVNGLLDPITGVIHMEGEARGSEHSASIGEVLRRIDLVLGSTSIVGNPAIIFTGFSGRQINLALKLVTNEGLLVRYCLGYKGGQFDIFGIYVGTTDCPFFERNDWPLGITIDSITGQNPLNQQRIIDYLADVRAGLETAGATGITCKRYTELGADGKQHEIYPSGGVISFEISDLAGQTFRVRIDARDCSVTQGVSYKIGVAKSWTRVSIQPTSGDSNYVENDAGVNFEGWLVSHGKTLSQATFTLFAQFLSE